MSTKVRAPKRRIERVLNTIDVQVSDAVVIDILHTAEDTKTLVRILADLIAIPKDMASANATPVGISMIQLEPSGVTIATPVVAEALDQDPALQEIMQFVYGCLTMADPDGAVLIGQPIHFDTKAQRKLKVGDEITLKSLSDTANSFRLFGVIYLWFKE